MTHLNAASRLVEAASWFDTLTDAQKEAYLEEHPNSKYADDYHPSKSKDSLGDAHEAPEEETFMSKLRNSIIKKLGGMPPKKVTKKKRGFDSEAVFKGPDGERKVKLLYSPGALKEGPGNYEFGYWKDENTYVQMTKKEFKRLNKKQLQDIDNRQQMYGL